MIADKVLAFAGRTLGVALSLPKVTPLATAVLLLLSLLPGLYAATQSRSTLVYAVVYCSFSAFMLSYHVHEKAIMTALLPLTLLTTASMDCARLFIRTSALGLLGLFPLLFRVEELALKLFSYIAYMGMCVYLLERYYGGVSLLTTLDYVGMTILCSVTLFLEVIHPLFMFPWMEAFPLLLTSITCAIGLIGCWIQSGRLLYREANLGKKAKQKMA
jgi:alpha-1,3-glucosyltransferase